MDANPKRIATSDEDQSKRAKRCERDRLWEYRFLCLLLVASLALTAYHFVYSRINQGLRSHILTILRSQLPRHLVSLESVHLEDKQGFLLEGLTIALREGNESRVLVRIPRIIVQGDVTLSDWLQGKANIERVVIDTPNLALWALDDGSCSLQSLTGPEPLPNSLPPIDVRGGIIRVSGKQKNSQELICHDLNVTVRQNSGPENAKAPYTIQAAIRSSFFTELKLALNLAQDKRTWSMHGEVDELFYSSQWTSKLPSRWRAGLAQLAGFQGRIDARFEVKQAADQTRPSFLVIGDIGHGSLQHPNLPYPLNDLRGQIFLQHDKLQLRQATASSGTATFQLDADVDGLALGSPILAKLTARDLGLDERLYHALPAPIQDQWRRLQVSGMVDAEVTLQFDGKNWKPDIRVHARDGSVLADIFPYPVHQIAGDFHYYDGILVTDRLTAVAGGQTLRGWLRLARASPKWLIDLAISSDGPVPIDDELIAALTPRGQPMTNLHRFVQSLAPSGSVHLENSRFIRSVDNILSVDKNIELSFYNGAMRYAGFRYPIFDIQGRVQVQNQSIHLERIRGRNDSARIRCDGVAQCDQESLRSLHLEFDCQNVPLEEELQAALPNSVRKLWTNLRPSGVIDHVSVSIDRRQQNMPLELAVRIDEDGKDDSVAGRSVSLHPQSFPYLLSNVACALEYRPGIVRLSRFEASHDSSHVSAYGDFNVLDEGNWNGTLSWLPTTRLNVDQSLLVSLPEYLRNPLMASEFRGPLGISGQTLVMANRNDGQPYAKAWDLLFEIEDGQLAGGRLASGIRGSMRVLGENTENGPVAKGQLNFDTLAVRGIPVSNLVGPFAIVDAKLYMGRLATPIQVTPLAAQLAQRPLDRAVQLASWLDASGADKLDMENRRDDVAALNAIPSSTATPLSPGVASSPFYFGPQPQDLSSKLDVRDDDLQARCLAGKVRLHGTHPLMEGQTEVAVTLMEANLSDFLADIGENSNQAQGTLWIDFRIAGSLLHANTLSGAGRAWLRNANFYQMPVMTGLFRALSMKPIEGGVFESADAEFRIDGDRIPIDRVSFDGDIISLRGSGWTNLRRELQLNLYAYVGNRSPIGALFGPILSQNDSATMLQLEVSGTTEKMEFRRAIPLIGTPLQTIFPERVAKTNAEP